MIKILNVIRSYLVSLGFAVDNTSYNSARRSVDEMGRVVERFADSSAVKFAATGAAITGFVASAAAAVHQFTVGVAQADLQNEMFARQMWMSKDAAMSYKNSLNALGVSLQDLYLSPELMQKFIALRQQAFSMETPDGFNDAMRGVRDITFEFQRFKLEATYAVYWIGYYMTKYLAGPLGNTRDGLKSINDIITSKMPIWTKNVAQVLSWFARLGNAAYLAGKEIKDLWDSLGDSTKQVIGITAGFFALLKMGPLGWVIAGLTTLLLLIDDFATYERGGESAFPKLWEWIDKLKESLNDTGVGKEFKQSIDDLATSLLDLASSLGDLLSSFGSLKDGSPAIVTAVHQIAIAFKGLALLIEASAAGWEEIAGLIKKDPEMIEEGKKRGAKVWNEIFGTEDNKENSKENKKEDNQQKNDPSAQLRKQLEAKIEEQRKAIENSSNNNKRTDNLSSAAKDQRPSVVNVSFKAGEERKESEKGRYGGFAQLMQGMSNGFQRWSEGFNKFANNNQPNNQGSPFDYFSMASLMRAQKQSVVTSVSLSPVYHIYGATNPQGVVSATDRSNTNLLMRSLQGVVI